MTIRGRGFRLSPRKHFLAVMVNQGGVVAMPGWADKGTEQAFWAIAEGVPAAGQGLNQMSSRAHWILLLGFYKRQVTPTGYIFKAC